MELIFHYKDSSPSPRGKSTNFLRCTVELKDGSIQKPEFRLAPSVGSAGVFNDRHEAYFKPQTRLEDLKTLTLSISNQVYQFVIVK